MSGRKSTILTVLILFVLIISFTAEDAHAYVDPGTAGYLYQVLFIAFSGVIAFFAIFKNMIKSFFRSIFGKKK